MWLKHCTTMFSQCLHGLPAIIHSDNGKEFVNKLIEDVVSTWPGHVNGTAGYATGQPVV